MVRAGGVLVLVLMLLKCWCDYSRKQAKVKALLGSLATLQDSLVANADGEVTNASW